MKRLTLLLSIALVAVAAYGASVPHKIKPNYESCDQSTCQALCQADYTECAALCTESRSGQFSTTASCVASCKADEQGCVPTCNDGCGPQPQ
jgi:hypothetical protein